MKSFLILFLALSSLVACKPSMKQKDPNPVHQTNRQLTTDPDTKLMVYYFHNTNRCLTCRKIEASVKSVLENNYSREMKDGVIRFAELCVDEKQNKELVDKYMAYGATLVFAKFDEGREEAHDLTLFAFDNVSNQEFFEESIRDSIRFYLEATPVNK